MVAEADKKGCYDQLIVGDVVDFLNNLNEPVDLLLAADVLTYLGDLEPLFRAASTRVRPGGLFCFSVEHEDQSGWQIRPTGRYGHHPDYIHQLADKHGWQVLTAERAEIRKERDGWIIGDLYLLEWMRLL
jgi:predicted TPR repeat methyltransferase